MKKLFLPFCSIIFVLFTFNAYPSNKEMLILEEIQKSIAKDFKLKGKIKMVTIDPVSPVTNQKIKKARTPKKTQIQGNKAIQEQLRRNRLLLQKKHGIKSGKVLSGKEKIELMKAKNRQRIKDMKAKRKMEAEQRASQKKSGGDWMSAKQNEMDSWMNTRKKEINAWEEEKKKIIGKWIADRQKFLKRIPVYKKNLVRISDEVKKEEQEEKQEEKRKEKITKTKKKEQAKPIKKSKPKPKPMPIVKKTTMPVFPDYFIIDGAFNGQAKDQGKRPTCAAFAGIRALEIMLSRKQKYQKLSEQYFFWASKPKCQKSPCSKQGSWVLKEYVQSKNSSRPNIPLDRHCPYIKNSKSGNVSQTPLSSNCFRGKIKVGNFYKVKSMPEILNAIKDNHPVVGGFKLSNNFYRNKGYVFINDPSSKKSGMDSHAAGHALLLIGHMKLPKELHRTEGTYCLITANSWGIGWGKGGHACLSEKWLKKYRFDVSFIALKSIRL